LCSLFQTKFSAKLPLMCSRYEHGPDPHRSWILTFFGRIGSGPDWALVPYRIGAGL